MVNQKEILEQLRDDIQGYYLSEDPKAKLVGSILDSISYHRLEGHYSSMEFCEALLDLSDNIQKFYPNWEHVDEWVREQVTGEFVYLKDNLRWV